MKINDSDRAIKPEKNEAENLFDRLLAHRQTASISAERLRIIKELERLLTDDQAKFAEYLSDTIHLYETECEFSLDDISGIHYDSDIDPPAYFDAEGLIVDINDFYHDKNTTMLQYLERKRKYIIFPLQAIERLWKNKQAEEIAAELKAAHDNDSSMIFNAKKNIEKDFPLLENLTMTTIKDSSDSRKNEKLKQSLEEMRNDFRNNGFNV